MYEIFPPAVDIIPKIVKTEHYYGVNVVFLSRWWVQEAATWQQRWVSHLNTWGRRVSALLLLFLILFTSPLSSSIFSEGPSNCSISTHAPRTASLRRPGCVKLDALNRKCSNRNAFRPKQRPSCSVYKCTKLRLSYAEADNSFIWDKVWCLCENKNVVVENARTFVIITDIWCL